MILNIVILACGALCGITEDIAERMTHSIRCTSAHMRRLYAERYARRWRIENMPDTVHEPNWVKLFYALALRKD